ncbi:MAG: hypothetical protein L6R00_01280 [Phycisphaerae bacterium]|nr:hypothetical protein [Phycisphaerae bacterium]
MNRTQTETAFRVAGSGGAGIRHRAGGTGVPPVPSNLPLSGGTGVPPVPSNFPGSGGTGVPPVHSNLPRRPAAPNLATPGRARRSTLVPYDRTKLRSRAFTLVEALISVALMLVAMVAVGQIFKIASDASGRTVAHAELVQAAAAFEDTVRREIARLCQPGLLIIDSPDPVLTADIFGGDPALQIIPMRHDRLVFIGKGGPEEYESLTDANVPSYYNADNDVGRLPQVGGSSGGLETDTGKAWTSSEALVFIGPSFPDGRYFVQQPPNIGASDVDPTLTAKEWIVSLRRILLSAPGSGAAKWFTSFTGNTPSQFTNGQYPLSDITTSFFFFGALDAVPETTEQIISRIQAATAATQVQGLWQLTVCPTRVVSYWPDSPNNPNPDARTFHYRRAAFNLMPRIADIRIEWTDGSVVDPLDADPSPAIYQPRDPSTQWFGARRDAGESIFYGGAPRHWSAPDAGGLGASSGDVCFKRSWLDEFDPAVSLPESSADAFGNSAAGTVNRIESLGTATGNGIKSYRAAWLPRTWGFRPKALRFTFRVYDATDRIANNDHVDNDMGGTFVGDGVPDAFVKRYGLEFSFVVDLP